MPLYVYRCEKGHEIELQRKIGERNFPVDCEKCPKMDGESRQMMRLVPSLVSPRFPGADRWR